MYRTLVSTIVLLAGCLALIGCETTKSANPLSPAVAGPIPGVNITAPTTMQPAGGLQVAVEQQPITLVIENASTSGVRPLSYVFEVATDAGFTNKVFSREGIAPGEGRTSLKLPEALASGRGYYWRARAEDGANTGPYSAVANFTVFTPIVILAPTIASPVGNVKTDNLHPVFQFNNAARSGPAGSISYVIEVATNDSFTNRIAVWTVTEQANQTSLTAPQDLAYSTQYFWHVRAYDPTTLGPWSSTEVFQTPAAPPVVVPGFGGTPPPAGGGPAPAPGDAIDLRSMIVVMGPSNIASWPQTSTITNVIAQTGSLCIYHDKLGKWPATIFFDDPGTLVEGNQWVVANIGGKWYGGAADWYRPGQACKGVDARSIGGDAFYNPSQEPLHSWVPQPGEIFGVFSTTPARVWPQMRTIDERTNVVLVKWGG